MVSKNNITSLDDLYLKLIIESYINIIERKLSGDIACKDKLLNLKQYLEEVYKNIKLKKNYDKLHFIKDITNNFFQINKNLYNGKSDYIRNVIYDIEKENNIFDFLKKFDKFLLLTYIDFIHGNQNTNIKERKA